MAKGPSSPKPCTFTSQAGNVSFLFVPHSHFLSAIYLKSEVVIRSAYKRPLPRPDFVGLYWTCCHKSEGFSMSSHLKLLQA